VQPRSRTASRDGQRDKDGLACAGSGPCRRAWNMAATLAGVPTPVVSPMETS